MICFWFGCAVSVRLVWFFVRFCLVFARFCVLFDINELGFEMCDVVLVLGFQPGDTSIGLLLELTLRR